MEASPTTTKSTYRLYCNIFLEICLQEDGLFLLEWTWRQAAAAQGRCGSSARRKHRAGSARIRHKKGRVSLSLSRESLMPLKMATASSA